MRGNGNRGLLLIGALAGMSTLNLASGQEIVNDILEVEERRIQQAQAAQDQIDEIADETRSLFDEYQRVLLDVETFEVYNTVQENLIADQNREVAELRNSIDRVTEIERQILPLMTRMITGLERFIEIDVPFFREERRERVEELQSLITRSDVTTAEKFRYVMEAWQIELDYGGSIDTYTGDVVLGDVTREVDFLVIGRAAFLYLTPDGRSAGVWDQRNRTWRSLGDEYLEPIEKGLRIARQQDIPELFMIPVPPPEEG